MEPESAFPLMSRRGAFIVFEGLDKSGKTSQSKLLAEYLNKKGIKTELWRFPTRKGVIGEMIDKYLREKIKLQDETVHLLFSADRWEARCQLVDLIQKGITVIADRYAYSGAVYSAAKGLDLNWCLKCDSGLPAPDMVLFLNVSTTAALQRDGYGDERYEKMEFQSNVLKQYKLLMQRESERGNEWTVINADKPLTDVRDEIIRSVSPIFVSDMNLGPLSKVIS